MHDFHADLWPVLCDLFDPLAFEALYTESAEAIGPISGFLRLQGLELGRLSSFWPS